MNRAVRRRCNRPRGTRWWLFPLIFLLLTAMAGVISARVYVSQLQSHIEAKLGEVLKPDFKLGDVEFNLLHGLVIRGLKVQQPEIARQQEQPILAVREVQIQLNYTNLLLGRSPIEAVVLQDPFFYLEVCGDQELTLAHVFEPRDESAADTDMDWLFDLPAIQLRNLQVGTCPMTIMRLDEPVLIPDFVLSRRGSKFEVHGSARHPEARSIEFIGWGDMDAGEFHGELELLRIDIGGIRDRLPEVGRAVWDRFRPRGLASADLSFDLEEWRLVDWNSRLRVLEGSIELGDPPLRVDSLGGMVEVTREGIRIVGQLEGVVLKGGSASLEGQLGIRDGQPESLHIDLAMSDVPLTPGTREVLSQLPGATRVWDWFQPRGSVDLEVSVSGPIQIGENGQAMPPKTLSVEAHFKDVSAQYHLFQYPMEHLRGTVSYRGGVVHLDLEGRNGTTHATVRGEVEPEESGSLDIHVVITNLPLDERVLRANPRYLEGFWKQYSPTGTVDVDVQMTREDDAEGPPEVIITVEGRGRDADFPGLSVEYAGFPYRIHDIDGSVQINTRRRHISFNNLSGHHGDTQVRLAAGEVILARDGERATVDLSIESPALLVDGDLMDAFSEETRDLINDFGPRGSVAVVIDVRTPPDPEEPLELLITLAPVDHEAHGIDPTVMPQMVLAYEKLPYPIHLKAGGGKAILDLTRNFYSFMKLTSDETLGPRITIDGSFGPDSRDPNRSVLVLTLTIGPGEGDYKGLILHDPEFRATLPEDLRNIAERLDLTGVVTAESIKIDYSFAKDADGRPVDERVQYTAEITGHDCSIDVGAQFKDINGRISVGGESSPEHDHSFSCEAHVKTASLSRFAARDLTLIAHYNEPHPAIDAARAGAFESTYEGLFTIDPRFQERLGGERYRNVLQIQVREGELYGGALEGFIYVDVGNLKDYAADLRTRDVDLSQASQDVFRLPDATGVGSGWLQFDGRTDDGLSMWGKGGLHIRDARLVNVGLVSVVLLPLAKQSEVKYIDEVRAQFTIRRYNFPKGRPRLAFVFEPGDLVLYSPTLFLLVDGTLDFDQQLEVIVNPEFPIVDIPIIGDLLAIFDRALYLRVYGPLDDPRVQWNPVAQHGVEKE